MQYITTMQHVATVVLTTVEVNDFDLMAPGMLVSSFLFSWGLILSNKRADSKDVTLSEIDGGNNPLL